MNFKIRFFAPLYGNNLACGFGPFCMIAGIGLVSYEIGNDFLGVSSQLFIKFFFKIPAVLKIALSLRNIDKIA